MKIFETVCPNLESRGFHTIPCVSMHETQMVFLMESYEPNVTFRGKL